MNICPGGQTNYYRNEENQGVDANVNLCIGRADAKYVWIFSDNEIITDPQAFQMEHYIGCQWIHFAYQMEALAPVRGDKAGFLKDKLFGSLPAAPRWGTNGSFLLTGINLLDVFLNMDKLGYDKITKKAAAMVIKAVYPANIIRARAFWIKYR